MPVPNLSVPLGLTDKEAAGRFQTGFLDRFPWCVNAISPPRMEPRDWRFATGEMRFHLGGYAFLVIHGEVEMFLPEHQVGVLMRLLVAPDAPEDMARTAIRIVPSSFPPPPGEVRWRRYAPFRGPMELLAYGNRRREAIGPGPIVLLSEEQRRETLAAWQAIRRAARENEAKGR